MDNVTGNLDSLIDNATIGRGMWIGLHTIEPNPLDAYAIDGGPHVTIAHLGKRSRVHAFTLRVLGYAATLALRGPVKAEVFGVARFTDRGSKGEGDPIVLLVEGRDLLAMREAASELLSPIAPWLRGDPWIPHVTIARRAADEMHTPTRIDLQVVHFGELSVTCGDARVAFRLEAQASGTAQHPRSVDSVPWREVRGTRRVTGDGA